MAEGEGRSGMGKSIAIWVMILIVLVMVGGVGLSKLQQPEGWSDRFVSLWRLPVWLVPISGWMEVVGSLLLLVRRTASYGSVLVIAAMLGATGAHIGAGEWNRFALPLALAVMAAVIGLARRRDAVGPLGRK